MLVENRAGSERILALVVALEILIFAFTGPNFLSAANGLEIVRLGVELGLLALALTLHIDPSPQSVPSATG